jgi:hypothetical protein
MVDQKIMRQLRADSDSGRIHGRVEGGRAILSPIMHCRSCGSDCKLGNEYEFSMGTVRGNEWAVSKMSDTTREIPDAISAGYKPNQMDCCSDCIPSHIQIAREKRVWII